MKLSLFNKPTGADKFKLKFDAVLLVSVFQVTYVF